MYRQVHCHWSITNDRRTDGCNSHFFKFCEGDHPSIGSVLAQCVGIDTALLGAWPKKQGDLNDFLVTKTTAMQGDVEHIMILAKWYLFGDKDGIDRDAKLGYKWCERAADLDNPFGKAYQGVCLVCGLGVERDFEEGNDLLVEAASQEVDDEARGKSNSLQNCRFPCNTSVSNRRFILHPDAHFFTDFAAFHLGCFYKHGKYGFRLTLKKAQKWFAKVQSKPTQFMFDSTGGSILEHERLSEPLLLFQTSVSEAIERDSIDEVSSSTATTRSCSKHSSSTNSLDYEQILEPLIVNPPIHASFVPHNQKVSLSVHSICYSLYSL